MYSKLLAGIALTATLFTGVAQADVVRVDWKTEGDARIALDEDTGIEWMRLNETFGMSVNQVIAETEAGGKFSGWRLPTPAEVEQMMKNVMHWQASQISPDGTTRVDGYNWYTGGSHYNGHLRDRWSSTLGLVYNSSGRGSTYKRYWRGYGLFLNDADNAPSLAAEDVLMSGFAYQINNTGTSRSLKYYHYTYNDWTHDSYNRDFADSMYGVYLVSDGGMTLSSKEDPSINANNPASPYNVPVTGAAATLLILAGAGAMRRRQG